MWHAHLWIQWAPPEETVHDAEELWVGPQVAPEDRPHEGGEPGRVWNVPDSASGIAHAPDGGRVLSCLAFPMSLRGLAPELDNSGDRGHPTPILQLRPGPEAPVM